MSDISVCEGIEAEIKRPSPRRSAKHRANQPRQSPRKPRTTDPRQSPRKSRDRRSKPIKYPLPKQSDLLVDSYDTQSFQTMSISTPDTEESSIYDAPPRRRSRHSNVMLCGSLGSEDEIVTDVVTDVVTDAKTSFRQIMDTLKKFGPDEREAVRETLVETGAAIKGTLRKWAACGK